MITCDMELHTTVQNNYCSLNLNDLNDNKLSIREEQVFFICKFSYQTILNKRFSRALFY
jgi:hypothetical protein